MHVPVLIVGGGAGLTASITSTGAVPVRPDRFVAWRVPVRTADPQAVLAEALDQILDFPDATSAPR